MIDSAFYGLIFNESLYSSTASWTIGNPDISGYASFLHGRVVDMFHFPIIEGYFPKWIPYIGGKHFEFFKPIFNVADTAISIGVFNLLAFNLSYFKTPKDESEDKAEPVNQTEEEE